jgi:hypothetical protein
MTIEHNKRLMADGSVKVYRYHRLSEIERARGWLDRAPLIAVPTGKGHAVRWMGRTAKHRVSFHDQVIVRLIREGYAVCLGEFVEKKGVQR